MRKPSRLNEPDLLAAVVAGSVGAAGLWFGASLEWGAASSMGPGYLPLAISGLLLLMAIALLAKSMLGRREVIAAFNVWPAVVIVVAIAVFGFALERIGLAATVLIVSIITTFAGGDIPVFKRLALSVLLSAACVVLFVIILGQPIQVWW